MKTCLVFLGTLACGIALCVGQVPPAASTPPDAAKQPDGVGDGKDWAVRTFRLPVRFSWALPNNSLDGKPQPDDVVLEPLPKSDASPADWENYLRTSTALIGGQLRDYGLFIPEGSLFLYDLDSGTLVVRARESILKRLDDFAHSQLRDVKRNLTFSLEVVEADAGLARRWLQDTCTTRDHAATWLQAQAGLKKGEVKLVNQMLLQTTSGSRVEGACGIEQLHPHEIGLHGKDLTQWYLESHPAGLSLSIDPNLGPDDVTLDASVALRVPLGRPRLRREVLTGVSGGKEVSVPLLDLPLLKLDCEIAMQVGEPMLLGAWNSSYLGWDGKEPSIQVAFLRCERQLALPAENKELARRMSAHAEAVFSTANAGQREDVGLETRAYRVPPTFLNVEDGAAADVTKILESVGVKFPTGAKAVFRREPSTLVVKNTPENLEMIDAYVGVDGCFFGAGSVKQVIFTLEVVEGPSEVMRAMQQETMGESEHGDVLKRLHQQDKSAGIKFLDVMRLVSRSAHVLKVQSGVEHMYVESVESSVPTAPAAGETSPAVEGSPSQSKPAVESSTKPTETATSIFPSTSTRMVGTLVELQPSINPDGLSVEVQAQIEKHFALTGVSQDRQEPAEREIPQPTPSVRFHVVKFPVVTNMESGATRIIGLWKPESEEAPGGRDVLQAAFLRVDLVPFVTLP